ncbi:MAG TPA: PepSY-associated TM helix domain-containing protein [Methylophilus sp.]|jgi:hypothetical protein|nr:PepSY-associated TM helix domain-containing protein [Methylophilus sp.]
MAIKISTVKNQWLFWHQWIGIVACIGMVLWGLSGASHPLMSRLQPVPKQFMPPLVPVDMSQAVALPGLLKQQGITQFQHISLVQLEGQGYYRIAQAGAVRYFAMADGAERADAEQALAVNLANYYTGRNDPSIWAVKPVTQFEPDYHPVNRLLPVWRVAYDGDEGLRAYVDTEQSRLATLVDDRRAFLTKVFQFGHNWSFLQACSTLQLAVATLVLVLILASAVTGVVLYIKQRKTAPFRLKRWSLQWWHREFGVWVSLVILLLASTGLFHLWMSDMQQRRPGMPTVYASESVALSEAAWAKVATGQVLKLDIYGRGATLFWQVIPVVAGEQALPSAQVAAMHHHDHAGHAQRPAEPVLWLTRSQETTVLTPQAYASAWLAVMAGNPSPAIQSVAWVTSFANEYGFVFKRLPVLKVQTAQTEHTRYYLEPATGMLAATINDTDGLEGFVFAYLHKWSFQSVSKDVRDLLAVIAALAVSLTGLLGAYLFAKKRM